MLTALPPSVRIYVALGATDLRRSVDGLSALVRESLRLEPLSGHLFLFRNRRCDRLKILVWDRSGFCKARPVFLDTKVRKSDVQGDTVHERREGKEGCGGQNGGSP